MYMYTYPHNVVPATFSNHSNHSRHRFMPINRQLDINWKKGMYSIFSFITPLASQVERNAITHVKKLSSSQLNQCVVNQSKVWFFRHTINKIVAHYILSTLPVLEKFHMGLVFQ